MYTFVIEHIPPTTNDLEQLAKAMRRISLDRELQRLGLAHEPLTVRMTGCPNGCARPYVAELGFVGRTAGQYVVRVGGSRRGDRLNRVFRDLVAQDELVPTVRPLLELFVAERRPGEAFGDFCDRLGVDELEHRLAGRSVVARHG